MTQQFTDEDFKALAAQAAAMARQQQAPVVQSQPAPSPVPQLSNRTLIVGAVGGGVILLMALGAIAGIMQRPNQTQAAAPPPSPTPIVEASSLPSPPPSPSPSPVAVPTHVVWGQPGDILNIRSAPDGEVIGSIPAGSPITVTGTEGRWAITSYNGVSGYVSQKFLTPIGQDKGGMPSGS